MSASALARAWPASVSFFPAALALAKAQFIMDDDEPCGMPSELLHEVE